MTRLTHVKLGPKADTPSQWSRGARKWAKRMRRRARRRLEKRDPEGAQAMEGKYDGWLS